MALLKIKDFDSEYQNTFGGDDIIGQNVYTIAAAERIGTIDDILVDEDSGEFRYLLLNLGVGTIGQKVLLPIGRARMNPNDSRIYANLTKEQANNLPELEEETTIDYDYEEQVRGVYRPETNALGLTSTAPLESAAFVDVSAPMNTASLESSAPLEEPTPVAPSYSASTSGYISQPYNAPLEEPTPVAPSYSASTSGYISQPYNRDTYTYQKEPALYEMNDQNHHSLKLYQERLIANKQRIKTGKVTVGKHVETETAQVAVPVEKERVVIERTTPADAGTTVSPGATNFLQEQLARVEIYEETADIHKEAFVREEVNISKQVERDTVEVEKTLRREELDVTAPGLEIQEITAKPPHDHI
jgi:uncharacterized protein (TIGR02271 family)